MGHTTGHGKNRITRADVRAADGEQDLLPGPEESEAR
jgi:hypothetical protein